MFAVGLVAEPSRTAAALAAEDGAILVEESRGLGGDPVWVGAEAAAAAVGAAVRSVLRRAAVKPEDVAAACLALADPDGSGAEGLRATLSALLPRAALRTASRAFVTWSGLTGGRPGVAVYAGVHAFACGMAESGHLVTAGDWGPLAGEEGGAYYVGRRAVQLVLRAIDGRSPPTMLADKLAARAGVPSPEDLASLVRGPVVPLEQLAGLAAVVVDAAIEGDRVAREILMDAGAFLAEAARSVAVRLRVPRRAPVAVGGLLLADGGLVFQAFRRRLAEVWPGAVVVPASGSPAAGACRAAWEEKACGRIAVAGEVSGEGTGRGGA